MDGAAEAQAAIPLRQEVLPDLGLKHAHFLGYEEDLIADVERLRRYASTDKDIEVGDIALGDATTALQAAKAEMAESGSLDGATELRLIKSIDALSPKIYPATLASLEIADIMEVGKRGLNDRQIQVRDQVNRLITWWIWVAIVTLLMVFLTSAVRENPLAVTAAQDGDSFPPTLFAFSKFVNPIILGFLGACAFILRTILQGLANKTFVLRDGTAYILRSILGMILGFMVPRLYSNASQGLLSDIAIPFLAGYAVEPMFAALDTLVLTIRDAVSRGGALAGGKGK
jgi:hypothetical protein